MGCSGCCRYFPCLRFTIGLFTFLAFLMGSLSFISPAWLERETPNGYDGDYKTYSFGLISRGGILQLGKEIDATVKPNEVSYSGGTRYVWQLNNDWNQWGTVEEKTIMIVYATGLLFMLISLWNISITECVPIKNQSTMLIMMVVWDVLAALCISAAILVFCATWHTNKTLKNFCENNSDSGAEFKSFGLGICTLSWSIYGAVATACTVIFVAVLSGCASRRALNDHQYTVKRNGVGSRENINTTWM